MNDETPSPDPTASGYQQPIVPPPQAHYSSRLSPRRITLLFLLGLVSILVPVTFPMWTGMLQSTPSTTPALQSNVIDQSTSSDSGASAATATEPPGWDVLKASQDAAITNPALHVGQGINHDEERAIAGYTVSAGEVNARAAQLITLAQKLGGDLVAHNTDNRGGPVIVHTQLTLEIPQTEVDQFLATLPADYKQYGLLTRHLDRTNEFRQAVSQQDIDTAELNVLKASPAASTTSTAQIESKMATLSDAVDQRQAALAAAAGNHALSNVVIFLDERQAGPLPALVSAWRLGVGNIELVATGLTFLGLTLSPALVLMFPFWVRRRLRRRHLSPVPA